MRRIALLLLVVALALVAAGCGASAEGDEDAVDTDTTATETDDAETTEEETELDAAPIAASQVVQQFLRSEEGAQLERTATPDSAWEQLGVGLNATPKEQRTFGTFTIYVVEPENDEAVTSLLSDKDTAQPLAQGSDGIYWDYDELAKSHVAYKRYGSNVVLAWWNEQAEQGTDERWERLDALMEGLTAS